ncbi:MAG: hypothetical protein GXP42_16060 [Chloroflexi bacterium]|nr:hypothetical protein [Chloroflexota bacterium]
MGSFGFGFVMGLTATLALLALLEKKNADWSVELPSEASAEMAVDAQGHAPLDIH